MNFKRIDQYKLAKNALGNVHCCEVQVFILVLIFPRACIKINTNFFRYIVLEHSKRTVSSISIVNTEFNVQNPLSNITFCKNPVDLRLRNSLVLGFVCYIWVSRRSHHFPKLFLL
jgi:hypothetical protein